MGRKGWWAVVVGILAILPAGSFGGPLGTDDQCVPQGLPPFTTWELRAAKSVEIVDEHQKELTGLWAFYTTGTREIATIWVGRLLVSVDPEPRDRAAVGWHDRGAVLQDTTLRAERRQACDWFQPLREPTS